MTQYLYKYEVNLLDRDLQGYNVTAYANNEEQAKKFAKAIVMVKHGINIGELSIVNIRQVKEREQ